MSDITETNLPIDAQECAPAYQARIDWLTLAEIRTATFNELKSAGIHYLEELEDLSRIALNPDMRAECACLYARYRENEALKKAAAVLEAVAKIAGVPPLTPVLVSAAP